MSDLAEIVRQRLAAIGRGPTEAEKVGGLGKNFISDLVRNEKTDVRATSLPKLAKALDWTPDELAAATGRRSDSPTGTAIPAPVSIPSSFEMTADVPVLGTAAASVIGAFIFDGQQIDIVRRPPALANARNVYALYIRGDSMMPRYRPGEMVFVSPDRPAAIGDDVIIQTQTHAGATVESWIKTLARRSENTIYAQQLNPVSTIHFPTSQVVAMHRVLTMRELFGM